MSLKERYREMLVEKITAGNARIARMEELGRTGGACTDEYRETIDNLYDRGKDLEKKGDKLHRTEGRAWESMRQEIEEAVEEWGKAIEEAGAKFRTP